MSEGSLRISELSLEGQVPTILLRNFADEPVLILDGEELVGAKQNRVLNLTVLVPAKAELTVPVSCVEQGRWAYNTPEFKSSKRALYAGLRERKVAQVSESLALSGSRAANHDANDRNLISRRDVVSRRKVRASNSCRTKQRTIGVPRDEIIVPTAHGPRDKHSAPSL